MKIIAKDKMKFYPGILPWNKKLHEAITSKLEDHETEIQECRVKVVKS